jgi:hypothetical protein
MEFSGMQSYSFVAWRNLIAKRKLDFVKSKKVTIVFPCRNPKRSSVLTLVSFKLMVPPKVAGRRMSS